MRPPRDHPRPHEIELVRRVHEAPVSRLGEIEIGCLRKRQQVDERAAPEAIVVVRDDHP